MTNVRHSPVPCTQSDVFAEAVSAEPSNIVLETSPPDYVKKISRYLEGQSGRDEACENPSEEEEEDSDSGSSLFITQVPVPEAVRSRRRTTPATLHGSTAEPLLSDSHGKSKTHKRKVGFNTPKRSFVSLKEWRSRKAVLHSHQNIGLHYFAIGGFFESVRQLWQNHQGEDGESSLPTIDVDGESISPISEGEEEEKSEEEDIKVVPRGCLVVSKMKKCSRPWYTPTTEESQLKQQRGRTHDASQRGHEIPTATTVLRDTLTSGTECSDDGDSSCRAPTSESRALDKTETPRRKTYLAREMKRITLQQKERKDDPCNSDAVVCKPSTDGCVETDREASGAVAEPQADVFHPDELSQTGQAECEPETLDLRQSDTNNDTKKGTKSPEEPGGQDAAVEIAEVTLTTDEPELNENGDDDMPRQAEGDGSNSKEKKKKRRKRKASTAEDVRQEVDGVRESDVRVEEEPVLLVNGEVDDVKHLKSSPAAEPPNDDAEVRKKKTKRKKGSCVTSDQTSTEQLEERECLGSTEASQEMLESSFIKRKKKKKRQIASNDDTQVGEGDSGCESLDVSFANDVTTLEESTGVLVKKKKKKKRTTEREDLIFCPEEDVNSFNTQTTTESLGEQDTEVSTKKKKKKKKKSREISSMEIASDTVAQNDDSVSARKEEKKRTSSFLAADAEGKAAQTHEGKHPPSRSVAANVCGAENISVGEFVTESAEIAGGNLEESNDGVRKKKKKRKTSAVQESADNEHDPDFEEPNEMCQRTAAETGVKNKGKRRRNQSESLNSMERWESSADEAAVLKKKKKKGTPPSFH